MSGNCCDGVCAARIPSPVVVECTVTDDGVSVGCGDAEICILSQCDDSCEFVSPECCEAHCEPFGDLDPNVAECTVTEIGQSVGCGENEICMLFPCDDSCELVSPDCCDAHCEPFLDPDPTAVECVLEDGVSLGCGEGEICVENGACTEDCGDPEICCFDTCLPA